jgi:holliday junction DNA helicase RuvA
MISWLKGTIENKESSGVTLNVNGVGYRVFMLLSQLEDMKVGATTELHIHMYQRETGSELYGFKDVVTRQFFEQLISISGVGPKGALGVLEQARPDDIKKAITHGDAAVLTKVSGIGKKTAERIIVELKNKVQISGTPIDADIEHLASALEALTQLGYTKAEARQALGRLAKDVITTEDKVREALKLLGRAKA